jgi:hypothetical protein
MRPIPLTVFEQYLFHEHRELYPCRIITEWRFGGKVDKTAFGKAAQIIATRHPLLLAQVKPNWRGMLYWHFCNEAEIPIHWHHEDRSDYRPEFRSLEVGRECSFEYHVVVDSAGWSVFVNHSHVVSDGRGSHKVFHELLLAYENQLGESRSLPPINSDALRRRNRYGLTFYKKIALLPVQAFGLFYALSLVRRDISPLIPNGNGQLDIFPPSGSPHVVSKNLSREEFSAFRKAALRRKSSLNTLCIALFHTAIGEWRADQNIGNESDWIRIAVPVNLRSKVDNKLPACNIISVVTIDRRAKGLLDRERLIKRTNEDMNLVKRGWLSLTFLFILWLHNLRPNGILRMSRRNACRTTAILSNIGHIYAHSPLMGKARKLRITGATLESIVSAVPLRPHTQVALLLALYGGEFNINLNYDARVMDKTQATRLLDYFTREIRREAQ